MRIVGLIAAAAFLCASAYDARAATPKEKELQKLRARIHALNESIRKDTRKRDRTIARLGETERLIQVLRKNLAALEVERESSETRLAALANERERRLAALAREKQGLGGELRTAYINGRQERLKLLLSQRSPADVGRMSVYYRYLTEHRLTKITRVMTHIEELASLAERVGQETEKLRELEAERRKEVASLEATKAERAALVASLEARINRGGQQAQSLKREEEALVELIEDLRRVLKEFPVDSQEPFTTLKGKLAWPVAGQLIADFGDARAGRSVKWNGVLLGADRGDSVRAIARGRVAFSDWLPGLGLLLVLEHSDGYISLYGHNDTLNRAAGDWVRAGDVLATVGDSGGQARPALYFEIRRSKEPIDPHPWFKNRLANR